jgi:hypothetical protein
MPAYIHQGRFDTSFLGVIIRAQSLAELEAFRSADVHEWLPASQLLDISIEAFISDVSRLTVREHEIRHFHDALLYPFGSTALRLQIQLVQDGFQLLHSKAHTPENANVLPVPVQDWLTSSVDERQRWLRESNRSEKQPIPLDLPVLDGKENAASKESDDFVSAARRSVTLQKALEGLWRGPQFSAVPEAPVTLALWETSGVLCQLGAILKFSDENCLQRFADWFLEHGPDRYRLGFRILEDFTSCPPGPALMREMLALTAWMQMGRYSDNWFESSPFFRAHKLLEARRSGLRWNPDDSFLDLVTRWDECVGRSSIADLNASTDELRQIMDDLGHAEGEADDFIGSRVARGLGSYLEAHIAMKKRFLDDPENFVDPIKYIENYHTYPRPAIVVAYREPLENGRWSYDDVDATPADWNPIIPFEVADDLRDLVEVVNTAFLSSGEPISDYGRSLIRYLFKLEVLGRPASRKSRIDQAPGIDLAPVFKALLKGKAEKGLELLNDGEYQAIIDEWKPLSKDPLFALDNVEWQDLPYYRALILLGKCQLFVAYAQIREDDLSPSVSAAFANLMEVLDCAPSFINVSTDAGLTPGHALSVVQHLEVTLRFADDWLDWWGPETIAPFAGVSENRSIEVYLKLKVLLDEVTKISQGNS